MVGAVLVAVCTNHITLFYFIPRFLYAIPFKNSVDIVYFFMLWSVIKLEHVVGKSIATVSAALIFFILSKLC